LKDGVFSVNPSRETVFRGSLLAAPFFVFPAGKGPRSVLTRLPGGLEDGRANSWFTLASENLLVRWVFPRRVQTAAEEVLVHSVEVVHGYK
jgi:hypothetical protein